MRDILSIGEMVIDFLPGSEPGSYLRKAGGAPANIIIATARMGLSSAFCGKLGDDDFGHFLADTLKENGVEICVPDFTDKAITTMAFVTLSENGERSFTFARKPGADMFLTTEDVDKADIAGTTIIHAGSCSLSKPPASDATIYGMKLAHEAGKLVSFDVNYRNLMWNDDKAAASRAVLAVLPYVDLLKISDEEADIIGGEQAIPAIMKENNISVLVETLGSKGSRWYFDGLTETEPSIPSECVDTCGAGDAFWGAFLSTLVNNGVKTASDLSADIIRKAARTGSISGALCVRKKGAIESLPTLNDIKEFESNE